jgi:hypothetical protein
VFEDWQLWRVEVSWVAEKEVPVTQLRQKMLEELQAGSWHTAVPYRESPTMGWIRE